jgi:Ca-activated chloride channel family protein
MKTRTAVGYLILGAGLALLAAPAARAGAFFAPKPGIQLQATLNCPHMLESGGMAYLQLSVVTPAVASPARRPMNLAVVLDRSGSMGSEEKMENARAAVRSLIDNLRTDDILSIVVYDDVVEVLRVASPVGDRRALKRLIDEVYPRGWTNLGGGLLEGYRQVARYRSEAYVNRVILLSDGLANRGITSHEELRRIARRQRDASVSLTTIGVGLEYNENLMVALAEGGAGNYYFVEHARSLAEMFRAEFTMLAALVAQNAVIEVTLHKGVEVVDLIGCEYSAEGRNVSVAVGDLYSSECREFTVLLRVPPGRGNRTIASATLRCTAEDNGRIASNTVRVGVHYTPDVAEVARHRDWEVEAKSEVAASTRRVEEALAELDRGDKDAALARLNEARQGLAASPAVAAGGAAADAIREQEARVQAYADTLSRSDETASRAKKSIQYENYQTQKKR